MAHITFTPPRTDCLVRAVLITLAAAPAWGSPSDELFFKDISQVNEGQLRFLAAPPDKPVHGHQNRVTVNDQSLVDGWVLLEQCHDNLDAVPKAQVVYRPGRVRNLQVVSATHIGRAWAETSSIQLEDVQRGAVLCIRAETQALSRNDELSYNLSNGPYMRKFLDGYYPMRVSMTVRLETDKLRYVDCIPEEQPGFRIWRQEREVGYEAVFEGILTTVMRFDSAPR